MPFVNVKLIGIDLPLKILLWQDAAGKSWVGYNDPVCLARRHGVHAGQDQILGAMTRVLAAIAGQATGQPASNAERRSP